MGRESQGYYHEGFKANSFDFKVYVDEGEGGSDPCFRVVPRGLE